MRITVDSTTKIVELNGVPARIWEGNTDSGIPVHCYVTRIAVLDTDDREEFERELSVCREPSPVVDAIPLRLIV